MKALWKNTVIAESDDTVIVENNYYFPPSSVHMEYLRPTDHHTVCPWKGEASYYDIVVDGEVNHNAAWQYQTPKDAAAEIKNHIAFWQGVQVSE